jgi:hypothetical protein
VNDFQIKQGTGFSKLPMPGQRKLMKDKQKRFMYLWIASGCIFIGMMALLMKIIGESHILSLIAVGGWIVFFAFLVRFFKMRYGKYSLPDSSIVGANGSR